MGEALIDVVRRTDGSVSDHLGGSPFNVAVGLARLGSEVGLATRVGPDEHGRSLVAHLRAEGVELLGEAEGLARTSTATATLDAEGVASYEFDLDWDLPELPLAAGSTALHTGSLGVTIEPGASTVLRTMAAVRERVLVSYDPNARPKLTPDHGALVRRVEEAVALAHVVKASEEDFEFLYPGTDFREVAARWLQGGTELVVVTRGGDGAWASTSGVRVDLPALPTDVVDTVGAGDAFMSGLLDALRRADLLSVDSLDRLRSLDEPTLRRLALEAATVASITCERAGANPPTRAELEARLAR
ncbi:fructokinase [Motilibacter peucedani]|uniref:Fructokinase n=1 Tax=Motilibacter peucedani TaxID=598650 RepID=A0A420XVB4_9ACTN|nr:carbohydrate kinase [Motilibacter peucedani]RKS80671.1 fructokinase [Motilibacter peucedani]